MVALAPATATLKIGTSATLVASVSAGGAPLAGKTVQFASSNAAVASVAPASATTDGAGQARVTVAGLTSGNASISARAEGAQANAAITVPAKTPALSWLAWLAIGALTAFGLRRRGRRG